jgi:hypothetical protein
MLGARNANGISTPEADTATRSVVFIGFYDWVLATGDPDGSFLGLGQSGSLLSVLGSKRNGFTV